jgi:hypothetical protein
LLEFCLRELILSLQHAAGVVSLGLRQISVILRHLAMVAAPVASVLGRTIAAGFELSSRVGKGAYSATAFAVKWVASVKDDFQGETEREINPLSLTAKLLVIVVGSSVSIILLINLVSLAVLVRR